MKRTAAGLLGLATFLTVAGLAAADRPTRQGNAWGINFAFDPNASENATIRLLGLARSLVGDWGYLRHGLSPSPDIEATRRAVAMIRAHHLIPVVGGAAPDPEFCEPGKHYPRTDPDGSMRTAARAKARLWKQLYDAHIPFYAVEVMNEINIDQKFPADKYAQWLYDYAVEVKKAYPGLKVCSCGMAGSGADYYDQMLTARPELSKVVDFWGLHPYGANHPPEVKPAETTLRSFELTARVLERHGVDPIRLMCTETGYELEIGETGKNPAHPAINEQNRAEYMARAFRDYYVPDPRIEMVSPFLLWDLSWHGWDGWSYMNSDGLPKPIYLKSMAEPKSGGKDWMPQGPAAITGRVTWASTDIGVPRVVVYAEPGLYGAVTDDDGRYRITGLPDGAYTVRAFGAGYADGAPRKVSASGKQPGKYDVRVARESLIPAAFDPRTSDKLDGWEPLSRKADLGWQLDTLVRDPQRRPSVRVQAGTDQEVGLYKYGSYHSAYPSEVYLAEVFVRSMGPRNAAQGRPWLELAAANGRGELLAASRGAAVDFVPDGKWHRITAACLAPPRTSRVRVTIGVTGGPGTFWFSVPFVGEADFPLPADTAFKTTGCVPTLYEQNKKLFAQADVDVHRRNPSLKWGTISGAAQDFRGRPVPNAVVATDSPVFVAVTDRQGRYTLSVPAGESVRPRLFAPGLETAIAESRTPRQGDNPPLDFRCPAPPAPEALVNGGFNRFTKGNPGQVHGWHTFGTTDGSVASGKTLFKVESFEGEGLYLAQAGSNVKNGGAWQMVQAVSGRKYQLTARIYTNTQDDAKRPFDNNCRIGIDPTGGQDPQSEDIVWSPPAESQEKWTAISVHAVAGAERVTVFIRHEMRRANTWNLTLFDDVQLKLARLSSDRLPAASPHSSHRFRQSGSERVPGRLKHLRNRATSSSSTSMSASILADRHDGVSWAMPKPLRQICKRPKSS